MPAEAQLDAARLYLVCDRNPGGRALDGVLEAALRGGVGIFQLRDKAASDDEYVEAAVRAREICHAHGALFIVNSRPDLAVAVDADGVHVGPEDGTIEAARAIVGPDRVVGRSTHDLDELAAAGGADYLSAGPVHATPVKPGRPAAGLGRVRDVAARATVPWFAVGGIDGSNVGDVIAAGATRIAVVRAIAEAADPERAARDLLAAIEGPVRA